MAVAPTTNGYIVLDDRGRPCIAGTSYRVEMIVLDHIAWGFSPAEIRYQHYNELTLAQIHAALAHYYDHQAEMDGEIERGHKEFEALRDAAGESPFVRRMRAEGRLA